MVAQVGRRPCNVLECLKFEMVRGKALPGYSGGKCGAEKATQSAAGDRT